MKFVISLILIMLLSFVVCLYLPWWGIAIAAFIVAAIIPQSPLMGFITGFCALFLLWGGLSFWISSNNGHILAHKVSLLLLKADNPYLLMLVAALIGALVGGFAALTGSYIRRGTVSSKNLSTPDGLSGHWCNLIQHPHKGLACSLAHSPGPAGLLLFLRGM